MRYSVLAPAQMYNCSEADQILDPVYQTFQLGRDNPRMTTVIFYALQYSCGWEIAANYRDFRMRGRLETKLQIMSNPPHRVVSSQLKYLHCTVTRPRPQFRTLFRCFGNFSDGKTGVAGKGSSAASLSARIEKFCFRGKYMDKVSFNWLSR
jgi:hypothetical protein